MAKKHDDRQLLIDLLGQGAVSDLPPELEHRVNEFIAEVGGCAFCGRPADLLCDHIIGFEMGEWSGCSRETAAKVGRLDEFVPGKGLPCAATDAALFTCDAPLCQQCTTNTGYIFWPPALGGPDSVDLCPVHAPLKGANVGRKYPMTREEANKRRRAAWQFRVEHPIVG